MPDQTVDWLREHRERIPLPLYCTRLESGNFEFVNNAFASFLERDASEFSHLNAVDVYHASADRDGFVAKFVARPSGWVVSFLEYRLGGNNLGSLKRTRRVVDIARSFTDEQPDSLIVGFLGDVPDDWEDPQLTLDRIGAYEKLLNMLDVGVHQFNAEGKLVFMNQYERRLLDIDPEWLKQRFVWELSPEPLDRVRERVQQKIEEGGNKHLTLGEHRSFVRSPKERPDVEKSTENIVPVNIFDVEVNEPDRSKGRRNREIFTLVVDARLPSDVLSILEQYGCRNPLLEEVGIATFIKVKRQYAHAFNPHIPADRLQGDHVSDDDLVFAYGNARFVAELIELHRPRVIGIDDIIGRMDRDLWGSMFHSRFTSVDRTVIGTKKHDERIERHPSLSGDTRVQVVKLPLFLDETKSTVIGVQGFYWDVSGPGITGKQKEIQKDLNERLRPWEILNEIPLPIFMKVAPSGSDPHRRIRYTYANKAYLEHLQANEEILNRKVASLHDIIGWTDSDLFVDEIARDWEGSNRLIIDGKRSEVNESVQRDGRTTRILKKPLFRKPPNSPLSVIVGLRGIVVQEPDRPDVWVDWRCEPPRICVDDGKQEKFHGITKHQPWHLFEVLLHHHACVVTYAKIAKRVLTSPNPDPEKQKFVLQQHKKALAELLPDAEGALGIKFEIESVAGEGYRMTVKP